MRKGILTGMVAATAAVVLLPLACGAKGREIPVHTAKAETLADTGIMDPRFAGVLSAGVEYRAIIELAKGGRIELALFAETAPNHVASFVSLARKGFYNGTTFHRVLPGFMAQGGDPTGTGGGGPGYNVRQEFSNLPHKRGALSMARANDPNSAGSQFFICFADARFLDGKYTVFGEVVKGMEVVDKIRLRDPQQNPNYPGDAMKMVTIREIRPSGGGQRGR